VVILALALFAEFLKLPVSGHAQLKSEREFGVVTDLE
jgi:hypothetical protein